MSGLKLTRRHGLWHATGTIGGERIRKSLKTGDRGTAEELKAQYEAQLWKRHTYGEEAVRTFEEAAVSYLEQGGQGRFLPAILQHFKGSSIARIMPGDVREMAMSLYPDAAASTRNRQAIVPAVAVINHAHEKGWRGPIRVKHFPVQKSRKHKPVDRNWLNAFMSQADADGLPHLSALVLFMHQTGARRTESIRLTGKFVDLSERVAVLETTKTDEYEVKHLTAELVVRLSALPIEDDEPVFVYTEPASVNRRMKAVCKRADIPYRPTHSAGRHSFGTNAMKLPGARVKSVMAAGGWKSARLFLETYVHDDDGARELAKKMDDQTGLIGTIAARGHKAKK